MCRESVRLVVVRGEEYVFVCRVCSCEWEQGEREAEAAACAPTPSVRLETAPGAHRSTRAGARQSITNLGDCVEDPWIVRINGQQ